MRNHFHVQTPPAVLWPRAESGSPHGSNWKDRVTRIRAIASVLPTAGIDIALCTVPLTSEIQILSDRIFVLPVLSFSGGN